MVFTGLLYKIAAAPFHYWSPDVYEGAPTTATGFFSVVPKAAGFAILLRVLVEFFPLGSSAGVGRLTRMEFAFAALAILTMTVGNLAALGQTNAKRMLAYSSIAHAGYMLAGFAVLDDGRGPAAVLFYLLVYLFMNLGAFLVLVALENLRGGCELSDLRGSVRREPLLSVSLVIFLFSLTGLPPLAGFTGKYLILLKLADRSQWFLILLIGINSVISLYYYMRLAKAVAIDPPEAEAAPAERSPHVFNLLAAAKVAMLILLFVYFEPVFRICIQVIEPLR
jgi:NADH-quinone oxidoreductase subunit N